MAMSYADISVVCDGALDESVTFTDETVLSEYLEKLAEEARGDGVTLEVYRSDHEHEDDGSECCCVQYETDHHPYRVFGPDREAGE